jgi:hypothetical protein
MNQVIHKTYKGCTLIFIIDEFEALELNIINNEEKHKQISLHKVPIKFGDWYYTIPFYFNLDPLSAHRYSIASTQWNKVDNLTLIEILAKEKNLV